MVRRRGVRLERGEVMAATTGRRLSAEPDDEGEIEKSAKKSLHWEGYKGGVVIFEDFLGGKGDAFWRCVIPVMKGRPTGLWDHSWVRIPHAEARG